MAIPKPPIRTNPPISWGNGSTGSAPKNPKRPAIVDYATAAQGQTSPAYVNSGKNQYKPHGGFPPPTPGGLPGQTAATNTTTPSTSLFSTAQTSQASQQPLTTSPTGQISLAAGITPFTAQQNLQSSTTTGKAGPVKAPAKPKSKPKAKKKQSALDKYLTKDSDYQNTIRDLTRALTDFKARQGVEKTRAGTEYGYAQRTMGTKKDQDLSDIQNDAAARGIATSGVYGNRVGDYNTVYNEQLSELGRQYNSQLDDFSSALRDFSRQQSLQKESARTAAIRRRSAKLGKVS